MSIEDLKDALKDESTRWKAGGKPLLADQMREMVGLLEQVKVEMQKEQAKKLKTLEVLMRSQVQQDSRYRVRKKPNGN